VLNAVFFDWGNTLSHFRWDDELLVAGHRAALATLSRADEADEYTARFKAETLPAVLESGAALRLDYGDELRKLLGPVSDDELAGYFDAEHAVWRPARTLAEGFSIGIVANTWPDPPRLLRRELEEFGIAEKIDAVVLSAEVGAWKPDPAIYEAALAAVGADATDALNVGDRIVDDIEGAAALGMLTAQALWFRVDERKGEIEPDFMAFTPADVLGIARSLAR
jgi:HAD superfamily hydrolase (TIGR01549 family)